LISRILSRLTYANVMATVAVFLSLGGGAYAIALAKNNVKSRHIAPNAVRSPDIKNGAVRGVDVRTDSITGANVLESTLGPIPRAARADTAATADRAASAAAADSAGSANSALTAGDAGTVGGLTVRRFNLRQPTPTPPQTVLELGGLRLTMSCTPTDNVLEATTTKQDSSIYVWGIYTDVESLESGDLEGGDFDTGVVFDVDDNMGGGGFSPDLGTLLYEARDGSVVTVDLVTDANGSGPNDDCNIAGTAIGG
jgi:hypothetical protein